MSILVVGSFVVDLVAVTDRAPNAGETVTGNSFDIFHGGKGANQAVAAKRLGADVTMAGCLGTDIFGDAFLKTMADEGFSARYIKQTEKAGTGCSLVTLETSGQNRICMTPGANLHFTCEDLYAMEDVVRHADTVVTQCEMQPQIVDDLAALCKKYHKRFILNPAPARTFCDETLSAVTVLTPNETELGIIVGRELETDRDFEDAAKELRNRGVENVIVTLGGRGSMLVNREGVQYVSAMRVKAVDTVGAGDCFTGSLAAFMDEGKDILSAMKLGSVAAGLQVQRHGAIPSMPYRQEVEQAARQYESEN